MAAHERTYALLGRQYHVRFSGDAEIEPFSKLLPQAPPPAPTGLPAPPRTECSVFGPTESGYVALVGSIRVGPERHLAHLALAFEHAVVRDALSAEGPICLHAAAVAFGHRAVLLPGRSGSGKTTLSVAMCLLGARLISDEIAVLIPESRSVTGYARVICMSDRDIALLSPLDANRLLSRLSHIDGATFLPPSLLGATDQPRRLSAIVFPAYDGSPTPSIAEITRGEATARLINHLYPRRGPEATLGGAADLTAGVPCYALRSGALVPTLVLLRQTLGIPLRDP